jgi:hypothetical protein
MSPNWSFWIDAAIHLGTVVALGAIVIVLLALVVEMWHRRRRRP